MGIISACQISCRSLPANVSVIGKAGSTAWLTAASARASRVAAHPGRSGCHSATAEVTSQMLVLQPFYRRWRPAVELPSDKLQTQVVRVHAGLQIH